MVDCVMRRGSALKSVKVFDPLAGHWSGKYGIPQLPAMSEPRKFHSCSALVGKLWVVGGQNDHRIDDSDEDDLG